MLVAASEARILALQRGGAAMALMCLLNAIALAGCTGRSESQELTRETITAKNRPETSLGRSKEFDYDCPEPGSYILPVIQAASDGKVVGGDGQVRSLRSVLAGRINILSFIYTRCGDPSACPRATGMLLEIQRLSRQDPVLAENVRLVTLSFDPAHDTPEVMKTYGGALAGKGGAEWHFLTTRNQSELNPLLKGYGQLVERKKQASDGYGPFFHMVRVYLIDRAGQVRNIYSWGLLDPRLVVTDIRTLLLQEIDAEGAEERVGGRQPAGGPFTVEAQRGAESFLLNCAPCHGAGGSGVVDRAPPLVGSSWAGGSAAQAIRIVLYGLRGGRRETMAGDAQMPSFGGVFSDSQVADLVTFVRQRFGGKRGPVRASDVGRVRAENSERDTGWTTEELLALP